MLQAALKKETVSFQEILTVGAKILLIDNQEISNRFDMSRSSVNRWRNGLTVPHASVRKLVYQWLLDCVLLAES